MGVRCTFWREREVGGTCRKIRHHIFIKKNGGVYRVWWCVTDKYSPKKCIMIDKKTNTFGKPSRTLHRSEKTLR